MNVEEFIQQLNNEPDKIEFDMLMSVIEQHYYYTPTSFDNGTIHNEQGQNEGSCKLFAFAQLNSLNEQQTLTCFGAYYREDVLQNPDADNHQNIRNFMKTGWQGIQFSGDALQLK